MQDLHDITGTSLAYRIREIEHCSWYVAADYRPYMREGVLVISDTDGNGRWGGVSTYVDPLTPDVVAIHVRYGGRYHWG